MILRTAAPLLAGIAGAMAAPAFGADTNVLVLPDRGTDNVLTVSLTGDRNGGTAPFSPLLAGFLDPGTLAQDGTGNALTLSVEGDDNLIAVEQTGTNNVASIAIDGTLNQMLLSQTGTGNVASIAQTGTGNMLAVRQRGR